MQPVLQLQLIGVRAALDHALESARAQPEHAELPWAPGDRVAATVEAARPNQRMLLRVGEFLFDAPRPPGLEAGQQVTLRYIAAGSRPTFALEEPPAEHAGQTTQVAISQSARQLDVVMRTLQPEASRSAVPVEESAPLVPAPGGDVQQLAAALKRSLEGSGLFYESHLVEWAQGRMPLEQIRTEPQARLSVPHDAAPPKEQSTEEADDAHPAIDARASPGKVPGDADAPVAKDLLQQVRNQLDVLDTRQINWQGQLWPGQTAQWQIDEPPQQDDPEQVPQWSSRLHVTMPRLGGVTAQLVLTGGTLRLQLTAQAQSTQAALEAGRQALLQGMREAGLDLRALRVSHGPE